MALHFNETESLKPIMKNETGSDFDEPWPESMKLFYNVYKYLSLFIYSLGVIANSLIILFIATKKSRKMIVYHFLLLVLAIIDLIICCWFTVKTIITLFEMDDRWFKEVDSFGNILFEKVLTMTANWVLVLLCFVKYRKILHPFKRQLNKKVCFLVSFLFFLSAFGFQTFKESKVLPDSIQIHIVWFENVIENIIPLVFLVFSHYKIWMYFRSSEVENTQLKLEQGT